jgi:uncharacterized protein YqjF (DUF2071 family)
VALLFEWYERWVHQKADHSFFITEEDKGWALQHWRLAEKKSSVVTHGTDIIEPIRGNQGHTTATSS